MRLTVVGCSGTYPSTDSPCSCYLVEADGYRLVIDLGNGALGPLQRHVDLYQIDAVVLSHLHADHCVDMCAYWVVRNFRHEGCPARLPVYGPAGTADRLAHAYDLPETPGMREVFDFRTLAPGRLDLGPLRLDLARVPHPVESFAMRVSHGDASFTYSSDTGPCDQLVDLAKDTDLLLCEASFTDGREDIPDLHLSGRQAGEHAAAADARRLVLTHIPPWTDAERNLRDARAAYAGPAELARSGAVYEF